jgi:hypothetical protein
LQLQADVALLLPPVVVVQLLQQSRVADVQLLQHQLAVVQLLLLTLVAVVLQLLLHELFARRFGFQTL